MYKLGVLPMNQRLVACGQHAGSAMHTAAVRQRTSHVCGALLQQQHLHQQWQVLQQAQAALHTSCQTSSTALCALQQQQQHAAAVQALPGHLLQPSRRYSKSWRQRAAARDSDTDTITTLDKQQQQQQWQDPPDSSSSQQQQQQQQQEGSPSSSAESSYDAVDSSSDMMRPSTKPVYSPLHYDVVEFARQVVPTPAERAEKQRVIQW
jgi:hypothetical protein